MAEYRAGEFATIPNIHLMSQLSSSELAVFVYLCWRAGKDKSCFPSYGLMEKEAGVSRRTAIGAINRLEELGWIKRQARERDNGSHSSNVYRIMQVKRPRGSAIDAPPSAKKDTGGSAKKDTPLTITNKNNNQLTTTNVVEPQAYGNDEITLIVKGFEEAFGIEQPARERKAAQWFRSKYGVEATINGFKAVAQAQKANSYIPRPATLSEFYRNKERISLRIKEMQSKPSGLTEITF